MFLKHSFFRSPKNPQSTIRILSGLTSKLRIDSSPGVSCPPDPLKLSLSQIMSFTDAGTYSIAPESYVLDKIRGELVLPNRTLHLELISVIFEYGDTDIPLLVRLWDHNDLNSTIEFLVSGSIIGLRSIWFGASDKVTGSFIQLLEILFEFFNIRVDSDSPVYRIFGSRGVTVIPNLNEAQLASLTNDLFYSISNTSDSKYQGPKPMGGWSNQLVETLFQNYCQNFGVNELLQLIVTSKGEKHRTYGTFEHPGITTRSACSSFDIVDEGTYDAVREVALIPYDYWKVKVHPLSNVIQLLEVDSMAGYNFPFGDNPNIVGTFERRILNLVLHIISVQSPIEGAWFEHCGQMLPVNEIELCRTMDEFLEISINYDNPDTDTTQVITLSCNLLLLTLLTPNVVLSKGVSGFRGPDQLDNFLPW